MVTLGILVIALGVLMIIGEFFTASHILIAAGSIFVITGVIFIATAGSPLFQVNWWLVTIILVVIVGFLVWAVFRIRTSYHHQVTTGQENLKGKIALVKEPLDPEGTILYQGELWHAVSSSGKIDTGEQVVINGVQGLTLSVVRKEI